MMTGCWNLCNGWSAAPKGWNIPKELKSQFFEFSPKIMNAHLTRAHLWIHVKRPKTPHHHNNNNNHISNDPVAWIVVYKVVRNSPSDTPSLIHVSAFNKTITTIIIIILLNIRNLTTSNHAKRIPPRIISLPSFPPFVLRIFITNH